MSSEARIAANRLNAQKSTGPRTAEGKAAVSQNAVKHGLSAQCDVIRGEDQEEFELYREEMFWELNPVGAMQSRLAERIVSLAWRLRRAERIQNEAFDALLTKETSSPLARLSRSLRGKEQDAGDAGGCDGDPATGRTVVRDFSDARVLDRLLMYERRIESSLYRTMAELQKLQRAEDPEPTGGANVSRASRLRIAGGTPAPRPPADRENVTDSAKQSQSPAEDGAVCSVPVRASAETQDVASLRGVATSAADSVKQSQSASAETVNPGSPKEGDQTPDGVTTSGRTPACETKPIGGTGGNEQKPAVQPAAGSAKQSQRSVSAAAAPRAIPRARPRVAYHYHTTVRSY